jgi:hypothetical protein
MFVHRSPLLMVGCMSLVCAPLTAQKEASLPDLLKAGGDYLVQYSEKLGALVAEEEYMQADTSTGRLGTPKRVGSDVVWLGLGDGQIEGFRDVTNVDRVAVRPKDSRLSGLFKSPAGSTRGDARQLTEDGIRYYLSPNLHGLDEPTVALAFLRKENQGRSSFKLEGMKKLDGAQMAVVKFTEQGTQRLISSSENSAAIGRFWIDPATGAVHQTELALSGRVANIRVTVKYAPDAATGLLLPSEMFQQFDVSTGGAGGASDMGGGGGYGSHQSLEGRAHYSNFTQVPVDLAKLK